MILINGVAADSVAATDRGLAYGDGVSRTLLVNSVIGAWQVRECANRRWEPGGYTGRVREWLDEEED